MLNAELGRPHRSDAAERRTSASRVGRTDNVDGYRVETRATRVRPVFEAPGVQMPSVPVFVQYARRVSDLEATVGRVRFFLLFGVFAGTGLALAAGLLLARRAMAPIAELTSTARDIGAHARPVPPRAAARRPTTRSPSWPGRWTRCSRRWSPRATETEEMLDRQRRFVADASHELRTPLTSVLANLELLVDVLDGEHGEAARSALRSSQRMRRLVADLLLLARADAKRSAPREPTDLAARARRGRRPSSARSPSGHELHDRGRARGRRGRARRAAPALRQPDGERDQAHAGARAVVGRVGKVGSEVVLTVSDDGPGVPADLRERLFERFVRGDGDAGGSFGLGLSIVRAVAESHGGTVSLESPSGGGARFVVRLPSVGGSPPTPLLLSRAGAGRRLTVSRRERGAVAAALDAQLHRHALAQLGDVADDPDRAAALAQAVEDVEDLVERALVVERAEALVDEERVEARAAGLGGDDVGEAEREREAGHEGLPAARATSAAARLARSTRRRRATPGPRSPRFVAPSIECSSA